MRRWRRGNRDAGRATEPDMDDLLNSTWSFGGPLTDAPAETAWTILAVVAALVAVLAWASYRSAVVRIGVAPSFVLMLLRTGCVVALLLCIANPVRIERQTREPPPPPPPLPPPRMAVLVDRSDSMTQPDNRGRTRLDDALATWRRIEKVAAGTFSPPRYYSFAEDLRSAATLEEAAARTARTGNTLLYRAVEAVLKQNADERLDALVVLTDGLDTTADPDARLREAALAAGVPVYFVAGSNRSARPEPFLRVREWRAPAVVMRNTAFTLEATFEAFSRADRAVSYSLWQGDRRIDGGRLELTTGANLVPRSFTVNAGEPGQLDFTLRLGDTAQAPVAARSITRVLDQRKVRVLVFQGALDWGFRYFTEALRTDANFEFATIVSAGVGLNITRKATPGGTVVGRLPDSAKPLEPFDCIVLARTAPRQLDAAQQAALVEFARQGGSVVFVSPDASVAPQFAGSALQELLPVVIEPDAATLPVAPARRRVLGRAANDEGWELTPVALTDAGRNSPIFANSEGGTLLPSFFEFVPVSRLKPGAEALAVHPTSRDPRTGAPHVLLATETFGRGRTVLLATDALWRWKMSVNSESRVVEKFWQQLILAVGRRATPDTLRFTNAPAQLRVGQAVTLRLGGATSEKPPVVGVKSPKGVATALKVAATSDADAPWSVEWTPDEPGAWEVAAVIEGAFRAHIYPSVVADVTGELARTPPALEALRALAGETGGALLTQEAPAAWRRENAKEKPPEPVVTERRFLKWNTWHVLWVALGFYAAELVLRRLWKLL
jgi:hypothetical protein